MKSIFRVLKLSESEETWTISPSYPWSSRSQLTGAETEAQRGMQPVQGHTGGWWQSSDGSLVRPSFCNKRLQTQQLQQQKFIFTLLWRLEVQDQGISRVDFWWGLFSWLAGGRLLTMSSHGPSVCTCWEPALRGSSSSYKAPGILDQGPTLWPH